MSKRPPEAQVINVENNAQAVIGSASILKVEREGRDPKHYLVAHKSEQPTKTGYLCLPISKNGKVNTDSPVVLIDNPKLEKVASITSAHKSSGQVEEAYRSKINEFIAANNSPLVSAYKSQFMSGEQRSAGGQTRDYDKFTTSLASDFIGGRVKDKERHDQENARLRADQTDQSPS